MAKKRKNDPNYIELATLSLDPKIKRGIFIVFVLLLGAVSLLSLFDLSGFLGQYLSKIIIFLFGWGRWLFPILLLVFGYLLYKEDEYDIKSSNYLGGFLFLISLQTLLEFVAVTLVSEVSVLGALGKQEEFLISGGEDGVLSGAGGGYFGLFLASVFIKLLGFWAGLILAVGFFLVSLMLMFDAPLSSLIGRDSWFAKGVAGLNYILAKIFQRAPVQSSWEEEPLPVADEISSADEIDFSARKVKVVKEKKEATSDKPDSAAEPDEMKTKPNYVKIDIPLDLLESKVGRAASGDIEKSKAVIKRTMENFNIPVEMADVSVGPTVTQYTFKPAEGVKLSKITTLSNDLALALAAHPIRIEAPIPGKSLVGIEVPNQTKAIVSLREVLAADNFKERKNNLQIVLGKDVAGKPWLYQLDKMPHLLVAGATNSGKSVCLNAVIVGLLYQNNPDDLKFIMVDLKRVELPAYNGIAHLLTPVITDVSKAVNSLRWCLNEMDRRYELIAKSGTKNIASYNRIAQEKLPYIVFIIDELADLMILARKDAEPSIIRLLQLARAAGIHLVLATQRPSVDVVTGLVKANMPARIAFAVNSNVDSRTILDTGGAENLLGKGDMLFVTAEIPKPVRIQGAFVSELEIKKVVNYIIEKTGAANYSEDVTARQKVSGSSGIGLDGGADGNEDEFFEQAKELVINSGKASTSLLQRHFSIGYARAARLVDMLEQAGVVGPGVGAKPREILISREQYSALVDQGVSGVNLHKRDEAEAPEEYLPAEEVEEELLEEEADTEEDDGSDDNLPVHEDIEKIDKDKTIADDDLEDEGKFFSR